MNRPVRRPGFSEHLELHRLDVSSSNHRLENYELAKEKLEEYREEHLKPEPLITGADLIGLGYQPGPLFSRILHALEDAQLEGRVTSYDEACQLLRSQFPQ